MTCPRDELARSLTPKDRSDFLAVLLRVARADEISSAERDRLMPMARWIGASDADLQLAMQRADDATVLLAELVRTLASAPARLLLFRESCAVAWVDGRLSEDETALLDRLALLLHLEDGWRPILDTPLACSPEGERRFLELLESLSPDSQE